MLTWQYILSQVCVILAMACLTVTFFTKKRPLILILSCFNALFFGVSYIFLQVYVGSAMCLVTILRGIWFYIDDRKGKHNDHIALIVSILLYIILSIITFGEWWSIFSMFSGILATYSVWQKDISVYRYLSIVSSISWITFNALAGSHMGIISESVLLIVEIVSLIKLYTEYKR